MYLYNFILQRATGITHAVHGCFAGTKQQEILLSKGKSLELVRPDPNTGKVHTLLQTEIFGVIRSLMSFRLTGGTKGAYQFWDTSAWGVEGKGLILANLASPVSETTLRITGENSNRCLEEKLTCRFCSVTPAHYELKLERTFSNRKPMGKSKSRVAFQRDNIVLNGRGICCCRFPITP